MLYHAVILSTGLDTNAHLGERFFTTFRKKHWGSNSFLHAVKIIRTSSGYGWRLFINNQMKGYENAIKMLDELLGIGKRSANRSTVTVAHSMLIAIYHMLKHNTPFKDLGKDYYTKFNAESKAKYYMKKLQELSMSVPVSLTT